jgi:hypothetical protein
LLGRKLQGVFLAVGVTLIVPVSALSALALPPSAVKRLAGSVLSVPADIFRGDEAISELQAASEGGPLGLGVAYLTSSRVGEALEAAANSDVGEESADLLTPGDPEPAADDSLLSELETPADAGAPAQLPARDDAEQAGGGEAGEGKEQGNGQGDGQGNGNENDDEQGNGNGQGKGNGQGNGNGNGDLGQGDGHGSEEGPGQGQGNDNDNGQGNGSGQGQDAPFTAPEPDQDPSDESGGSENESEAAGNQGGHGQGGGGQNGNGQGPKN